MMNLRFPTNGLMAFPVIIISAAIAMSFTNQAFWTKLGTRKVSKKLDHDEILVTGRSGTFNAVKLAIEDADVTFQRVIVVYRNGSREELQMRDKISAGGETRPMNLEGRNRIIRKVIFYYRTDLLEGKKAKVILFGRH